MFTGGPQRASCHPPIDTCRILGDHAGMRWSEQPGHKVEVPRHFLEALAEQMAGPDKWAYMLLEHARTIWKQLALAERARGRGRRPPGTA